MSSLLGPKGRISVLVVLALGIAVGLTAYVEKASARWWGDEDRGSGHTRYLLISSGSVANTSIPEGDFTKKSLHIIGKHSSDDTVDVNTSGADRCGLKHNGTTWVSDTDFGASNTNRWYIGSSMIMLHEDSDSGAGDVDGRIPPSVFYFFNSTDQTTHGKLRKGRRLGSIAHLDDSDTSTAKQCSETVEGVTWYFFKYAAVEP